MQPTCPIAPTPIPCPCYSCVDDPSKFGCEMLASRDLGPLRLEKLVRLDSRRPSRCGGDDHVSSESIDIRRGSRCVDERDKSGVDADGPSWIKTEVRRLSFSAVARGFSWPEEKSSLISTKAYDMRCKARLRGFSMIDGSRCSHPYTWSGVESVESLSAEE